MSTSAIGFTDAALATPHISALTGEVRWDNSAAVTYYLAFSDANTNTVDDWIENGAGDAFRTAVALISSVADIEFVEVTSIAEANLIERIDHIDGLLGFHFLPGENDDLSLVDGIQSNGAYSEDASSWTAAGLAQGGYGFLTLLHELGHAIGLEHPHEHGVFEGVGTLSDGSADANDLGDFDLNQGIYSVMSYNDGYTIGGGSLFDTYGWTGSLGAFDIAALQALYGANQTTAAHDDIYFLPTANQSGTFYQTLWDTGGIDEVRHDGDGDAVIFLGAATLLNDPAGGGILSQVLGVEGGFTIANGVVIENATGGSGQDLIAGNASHNTLDGGDEADVLIGLAGNDVLMGGAGNDLLIGDTDLSHLYGVDPNYANGISLGTGVVVVSQFTTNNTLSTAIDVSNNFSFDANSNVQGSTTIPHVTINGTGSGGIDVYEVTLNNPYAILTADVDGASFDSALTIFDSSGQAVTFNDDSAFENGAGGSTSSQDAYLRFAPGEAGTWYIAIAQSGPSGDIDISETYSLHLSVAHELNAGRYEAFVDELEAIIAASDSMPDGV